MTNPSTTPQGNIKGEWVLGVTLSPASIATTTTAEQTFAVAGLLLGDLVGVTKPTAQPGLGIVGSRVSAAGVLAITFQTSGASVSPTASEVYAVKVTRVENLTASNVSPLAAVPV